MKRFDNRLKVGCAPTRRDVFSREDAIKYKKLVEDKLKFWGVNFVNLDWLNEEGLLYLNSDIDVVTKKFQDENIDALFSPHCNFGTEDAVAKLAKSLNKPFLLWGPRDEAPLPNGLRLRDSQCGLFATSKILQRFGVPFTYITNSRVDSPVFEKGFKNFLAAASVVKSFRELKVGQIGTRPDTFWTVMINEGEILERFGIEVIPISLVEIVDKVKSKLNKNIGVVDGIAEDMKIKADCTKVDRKALEKMAALKLVISEWADSCGCTAVAIQCWNALQDSLGIMPCFVNAELTDLGLPVVCETDIHGAITASMVQAASMGETPVFFADLTIRHPENDNAELLWHCGAFPVSLKTDNSKAIIGEHYILKSGCPGVAEWEIRGGDISVARFDGTGGKYYLLMGQGKGVQGPKNRGTYVWFEVDNWPKWEEKLIRGPYIHHVACLHGKISSILYEACRYIPGLIADPVEPSEEEIHKILRE